MAICLALFFLSGCQGPLGYMVNLFAPPPKKDALFKPDKVSTLVFVDDLLAGTADLSIRRNLSEQLEQQLHEHKVFADLWGYDQIAEIRARNGERFSQWPIDEVGGACQVRQVLYVEISRYDLSRAGAAPLYSGLLRLQVKLVEVDTGRRIWPTGLAGHSIKIEIPTTDGTESDFAQTLSRRMTDQAADQVARLFYKHEIR